jgi:hypothetical protein
VDVHRPVGCEGARVVGGGGEIVDIAVGYLEDSLVDNVLVGATNCYYASCGVCLRGEPYYMPNWMCLMRAGILSTTCCFTA